MTHETIVMPNNGKRGCSGKRCYENHAIAARMAQRVRRQHDDAKLHAYKCRHCHSWHVGEAVGKIDKARRMRRIPLRGGDDE